jgi:uncharacterized surface anchored protein
MNTVNTLSGAEFTLYKYNSATSQYEIYQKDGKDYIITTNDTGTGVFTELPYGTYMVKETKAPKGYVLNAANQKIVTIDESNYPANDSGEPEKLTFVDTAINVSVNKFAVGGSTQLAGAVLELYEKDGTTCLQSWTTTSNAQKLDYSKLEVGKTYRIHEKTAPKGYTMSEDVCFTINSNGTLTYISGANGSVSGNNVIMRDQTITLNILKRGKATDADAQNLSGAAISLIDDSTGQTVYSFTSTTVAQTVPYEKLSVPETGYHYYTVHEDSAPGGYALADDIKIAIDSKGDVYAVGEDGAVAVDSQLTDKTVTMTDEMYVDFYFAKRDAVTGEALAGAQFTITDENGAVLAKWTSSNTPENIKLNLGIYTFTEVVAPNGYGLEKAIKFQVVEGETVNYIQILDGNSYNLSANGLTLTSRDARITVQFVKWSDQYQPLAGGTFEVHESNAQGEIGTLLDTFQSTGETMTLDNQNFKLGGYYVIVEQEAPENYNVTTPVYFHVNDDGVLEDLDGNFIDSNVVIFVDGEKQMCFQKVDSVTGNPVSGVDMRITSQEDEAFETKSWTTDGTTKYFGYSQFQRNVTYSLEETETVNGYSYAKSISFLIDDNGVVYVDNTAQQTSTIVMKNTPLTVSVDKQILGTTTGLEGAVLQVTDEQGDVLEQWETDGKPHSLDVSKLHASLEGEEYVYTLSEVKAPELYAMAQPIQFVIDKDGNVVVEGTAVLGNTLIMYDEYHVISFRKTDSDGKDVPGATLSVTSTEDTEFAGLMWKSIDKAMNFDRDLFKPNVTYILTETAAPDGYAYSDSISFKLDDSGVVYVNGVAVDNQTITMVDKALTLYIAKKDKDSDAMLANAQLSIIEESSQKVIHNMVSTQQTVEIPAGKLTASTDTQKVVYILRENEAPEGYELAKDIRFYIQSSGQVYVINEDGTEVLAENNIVSMYDEKTEETDKDEDQDEGEDTDQSKKTTSKKTGDTTPIQGVALLFLISVTGFGGALFYKKRKRK